MVMSFNVGRRNAMIDMIISDDIDTIMVSKNEFNDESFIDNILRVGHKGYEDYTDDELTAEMNERDLWDNWFKDQK